MNESAPDLRRRLEEVYDRLHSALTRRDLETFRSLADPAPSSADEWEAILEDLAESLPPRTRTRFLEARRSGDWAAYCFETDLEEPRWCTLVVVRFRRHGPDWKLSGGASAVQIERPSDPDALRKQARSDPFLALPGEPGYGEEE